MFFERMLEPIPGELIIDHDARDRHLSFWNAENIQRFWAGKSFYEPGEPNELSYSLAQFSSTSRCRNNVISPAL
jgi:hypothetical protein